MFNVRLSSLFLRAFVSLNAQPSTTFPSVTSCSKSPISAFSFPEFQHFPSTFDVRRSTFDVRRSMFDVRCSMFDVRCSMFDVRHSTFDFRLPEPSTLNPQLSTLNQMTTHHDQELADLKQVLLTMAAYSRD